jgi:hypothetical protein
MVTTAVKKMIRTVLSFCNQFTGKFPTSTSLIVPPPIAVTNEMMRVPKGSSFLSIAEKAPDTAKANVPRISMMLRKPGYMGLKVSLHPNDCGINGVNECAQYQTPEVYKPRRFYNNCADIDRSLKKRLTSCIQLENYVGNTKDYCDLFLNPSYSWHKLLFYFIRIHLPAKIHSCILLFRPNDGDGGHCVHN